MKYKRNFVFSVNVVYSLSIRVLVCYRNLEKEQWKVAKLQSCKRNSNQINTMFLLEGGRLIRINKDGSDGEEIRAHNTKFVLGSSVLYDHQIKDLPRSGLDYCCEIATDDFGRVSAFRCLLQNNRSYSKPMPMPPHWIFKQTKSVKLYALLLLV